jgi:hypothetical protein
MVPELFSFATQRPKSCSITKKKQAKRGPSSRQGGFGPAPPEGPKHDTAADKNPASKMAMLRAPAPIGTGPELWALHVYTRG